MLGLLRREEGALLGDTQHPRWFQKLSMPGSCWWNWGGTSLGVPGWKPGPSRPSAPRARLEKAPEHGAAAVPALGGCLCRELGCARFRAESFISQMLPEGWRGSCHGLPAEGAGGDPHGPVALPELS